MIFPNNKIKEINKLFCQPKSNHFIEYINEKEQMDKFSNFISNYLNKSIDYNRTLNNKLSYSVPFSFPLSESVSFYKPQKTFLNISENYFPKVENYQQSQKYGVSLLSSKNLDKKYEYESGRRKIEEEKKRKQNLEEKLQKKKKEEEENELKRKQEEEEENNKRLEEEERKKKEEEVLKEKKYKIPHTNNNVVELPEGYSTDDEDEYKAIILLNEDKSSWNNTINKEKWKIYFKMEKRKNKEGKTIELPIFFLDALINHSAIKVKEYLHNFSKRQTFDSLYKKGKIISEKELENGIKQSEFYLFLKMPFIFSDRDFVVTKKVWNDYNGKKDHTLGRLFSTINPDYPGKEDKPVRAEFLNRASYIKPINNNKCKLFLASHMDMKMNLGSSMMAKKGSEGQEEWLKLFIDNLK